MSKNLASSVLANAKDNETKRINTATKIFINGITKFLEKQEANLEFCDSIVGNLIFDSKIGKDVVRIAKYLGFCAKPTVGPYSFSITVLPPVKGEPKTYAQQTIDEHNKKVAKKVAVEETAAKNACADFFKHLESSHFTYTAIYAKPDSMEIDFCRFTVPMQVPLRNHVFYDKSKNILEENGFLNLSIDETGTWSVEVNDDEEE